MQIYLIKKYIIHAKTSLELHKGRSSEVYRIKAHKNYKYAWITASE